MKFGFVVTNLGGGGAEKAVLKLGAALVARNHQVHVVLLERLITHALPEGVAVHALTRPGQSLPKGLLGKRLAAWRLRRLLRKLAQPSFDLLVSTLPFADEVTIFADMPCHWCRIANTLSAEIVRLRATDRRKADRRLARYRRLYGARSLIAVSDGVADDLRGPLGITGKRIERIYNPFDFVAIRARAAELASVPKDPYIIHVGRFSPQKRHDLLLDAWARLNVRHKLVLLTPPDENLSAMIGARGLAQRVTVAGFQSNPYPWMAGADLLVLSSDYEGLPNVIIEALAVGTPVVSTDCPSGPREILGSAYSDCLVTVGDADALARAIHQALIQPPDPAQVDLGPYAVDSVAAAYERLAAERVLYPSRRNCANEHLFRKRNGKR